MTWAHHTPTKNYVQVPGSSPITVKLSPTQPGSLPPSMTEVSSDKEQQLERKRQAIRNHINFPMVRRKFHYLSESEIFRAFIKGKGNLRDITQILLESQTSDAVAARQAEERRKLEEEKQLQAERDRQLFLERVEQQAMAAADKSPSPEVDDEDLSPIKVRPRQRPVTSVGRLDSLKHTSKSPQPLQPPPQVASSTRVELHKPKLSILEKYKYKPQPRIDSFVAPRKRRLVRGTSPSLSGALTPDTADDLDKMEELIRANKKKAKLNQKTVYLSDNEFDDDDDDSDHVSEEEVVGVTSIDDQVLEFLNTAEANDLCDIASVPPLVAALLIEKRPFNSIYEVSEQLFQQETEVSGGRRRVKKPLGLKIVESTASSLKGYKAVESLVKKCSEYGERISSQMARWGVTVTGELGELEVVDLDPDDDVQVHKRGLAYIKNKPANFSPDFDLKNYQLVGLNWLNLLYQNHLSCILADEMGLGKTCQVIAFMAHLKRTEDNGPHLVVVPSSTLENWLREFHKFCPELIVQTYYGSQKEREDLRYDLQETSYDVLVTTYNLATGAAPDFKFLRLQDFNVVVYDEGHMLKNSASERYNKLMRLRARFRLLLTGTPLQNNLKELVSLLAFMLPRVFDEKRDDLQGLFGQKVSINDNAENYNPLLSQQAIAKAKTMMTPFVLRRKKVQVLKHLPAKVHRVVECELTDSQRTIYTDYIEQGKATRLERERRKLLVGKEAEEAKQTAIASSSNVMMSLRKASMHPLLFRTLFTDALLKKMAKDIMREPEYMDANQQYIFEDMQVMSDYELNNLCLKFGTLSKYVLSDDEYLNSGKITQLKQVLDDIIGKGEKVLVFSLFTQMLDILEKVLLILNIKFLRLDGLTSVDTRQDLIDRFYEDSSIPVFLLSTKAGGFGINLVAANNVVIYDQLFNPHDDKQAEDRAHRVGQTNEVVVTKLITKGTIEENMLMLAENKLQLDQSISGEEGRIEEKAEKIFEKLLFT